MAVGQTCLDADAGTASAGEGSTAWKTTPVMPGQLQRESMKIVVVLAVDELDVRSPAGRSGREPCRPAASVSIQSS